MQVFRIRIKQRIKQHQVVPFYFAHFLIEIPFFVDEKNKVLQFAGNQTIIRIADVHVADELVFSVVINLCGMEALFKAPSTFGRT